MKRKSLIIMLLMAFFAPLAMIGQTTYTYSFSNIPTSGWSTSGGTQTINNVSWTYSSSTYIGATASAIQIGSRNNPQTSNWTIQTPISSFGSNITVTGVSITAYTTRTTATYDISVGGNSVKSGSLTTSSATYSATNLNYTSGNIVVTMKGSNNSRAMYLSNISVTYTTTTPSISLSPASATIITGSTQTLTATVTNVTGTPTITYTSSNTNVATVSGSGTTATVTGIAPGTATITATMTYQGTDYHAQCAITVEEPSYCDPAFSNASDDHIISFVTTGGTTNISNTSTYNSAGYEDYYSTKSASIEPEKTLSFTVTPSSTQWSYGHSIWVDWNKDYTFSSDERVAYQSSAASGAWTSSFTVPANTTAGDYRMRVIQLYNNAATDPCASATYGEGEDYKLTVLSAGAYTITCATTTGGTITADKNNADENDVVTITATPETDYLLTALTYTPEGGSAQNIDITNMPYTFTMPAANVTVNATFWQPNCPKPSNVTVSNLAASHATVSWDSEVGNYTVKYSTATVDGSTLDPVFEDGFESGLGNWTTYANGFSGEGTTNWQTYDGSQFEDQTNHGGSYSAMSRSWTSSTGDVDVDNWLVSPQMTLGNTLKFWVTTNSGYPGSYAVYVSTGSGVVPSSGTGDFEVVANLTLATGSWVEQTYDLSAYAGQQGYVAIRHKDNAQDYFLVDDFGIYNTINSYSYGGWNTVSPNPTTNSCPITGLSAETLYAVQVQANCGGSDGSSAWSTIYFTTPDNCGAPQELASSNVTASSATLNWADDKDSYNLQYRKVYFHEGFESETMPTGWTTIDNNNDGLCWHIGSSTAHSGANGVCNTSFVYSSDFSVNTTPDDYLISPLLDLQGTLRVWLSGYPRSSSNYSEHFEILLSTTGTSVSDFTTTLVTESTTTNSYVEYTADLSSYTGKGYIAIHHFNCTNQNYLYVDDFGIYGSENWVTLNPNPTTETADLTGLTPNTDYEWQVQGVNCDGNGGTTEWSDVASFTTLEIPAVPVESITVNPNEIYPTVGATYSIVFTVLPADATNPAVTFSSDDATVATVDENGTVTAVADGTATITIAATDGSGVTGTLTVNVMNIDVEEITASDITVVNGQTATINYQVLPEQATDKSVTFTSANTAIATVDADGVVTGVGVGETTITIASVQNPEVATDITVTVTSDPNAVQFTLNVDKTVAAPGDVITVEAYLNAPESGDYNGFTGLVLGLHFDPTAFAVDGDPVKGPVANSSTMAMTALPNDAHPDLVQCSCVMPVGTPNSTTGLVFTVQFTVLTEVELGSYTFYAEPTSASNFVYAPDTNNPSNKTPIPYETTPSTVEITVLQTFTKHIEAYTGTKDNYYLIASPIGQVSPTEVTNMLSNNYDLYYFDENPDTDPETNLTLEWINYEGANGNFNLEPGKGYLYANDHDVDLIFTGSANTDVDEATLALHTGAEFAGWNLVGNPFGVEAYIDRPFYRMANGGAAIASTTYTNAIDLMEGVFVEAASDGETMTFSTTNPNAKVANLTLNLTQGNSFVDRAIVCFSETRQLSKFQFRKGSTKVYIPQEGKDYAVVRSEAMGVMPVNFKAENNGTYTLSFTSEEVSFAYLHLIDNMTGIDVDLLATPSYSFNAKTTDYESRFKLVFATGNSTDDTFAFFSNGSFVINNEGEATLQVIDVNGRILKSESINGCANVNVNAAQGIYMLRLVNGDSVKVQKVVVK